MVDVKVADLTALGADVAAADRIEIEDDDAAAGSKSKKATASELVNATLVNAAGAVMNSDISAAEGFVRKTGSGAYEAIKSNLTATAAPTTGDDTGDGYAVGSLWIDVTNDNVYQCVDATAASAVWRHLNGGGAWEFIEELTPSAVATIGNTSSLDTTTYCAFRVVGHLLPATNNVNLHLRMARGAGSIDTGTNYDWTGLHATGSSNEQYGGNGDAQIQLTDDGGTTVDQDISNTSGDGAYIDLFFKNADFSLQQVVDFDVGYDGGTTRVSVKGQGVYTGGTGELDDFQLLFDAGNIASGTLRVYGLKSS